MEAGHALGFDVGPDGHFGNDLMYSNQAPPPNGMAFGGPELQAASVRAENLNPLEVECYLGMWRNVDNIGQGAITGDAGADFLRRSGLPRETLHEIWTCADPNNVGLLDVDAFAVACRLVAHAQNGILPSMELLNIEPNSLPNFDVPRMADNMPINFEAHTGIPGLGDVMAPSRASGVVSLTDFAPPFGSMSGAATGTGYNMEAGTADGYPAEVWQLTDADWRKYQGLFQKSDFNGVGVLNGGEVKVLMQRSQLPEADLSHIWMLADADQDGCLHLGEFVVAMHLITKCKSGLALPPKLPHPLEAAVMQRQLPAHLMTQMPSPTAQNSFFAPESTPGPLFDQPENPPESVPTFTDDKIAFPSAPTLASSKRKSKSKDSRQKPQRPAKEDDHHDDHDENQRRDRDGITFGDKVRDASKERKSTRLKVEDEWGLNDDDTGVRDVPNRARPRGRYAGVEEYDGEAMVVGRMIEADKHLQKMLVRSVDHHAKESEDLLAVTTSLKSEVQLERSELRRQLQRKEEFEGDVINLRADLEHVKEEKRKLDLQKIAVGRDLAHYQEEIIFLKKQIADVSRDIEVLCESNASVTQSGVHREQQTKQLDTIRKHVLASIKLEQDKLKKDEREIAEMRNTLQRMRREKEEQQSQAAILHENLRQADQDRNLLFTAVEHDRSKLAAARAERIAHAEERLTLSHEMTAVTQQRWMQSQPSEGRMAFNSHHPDTAPLPSLHSATPQHRNQLRDAKGVPASTPTFRNSTGGGLLGSSSVPVLTSVTPMMSADTHIKSRPQLEHWTSFGTAPSRFGTTAAEVSTRRPRRTLDAQLRRTALVSDDLRSPGEDPDFDVDSTRLPLGSRRDNQTFVHSRGAQRDLAFDTSASSAVAAYSDSADTPVSTPQGRSAATRAGRSAKGPLDTAGSSDSEGGPRGALDPPAGSSRKTGRGGKPSKHSSGRSRREKKVDTPSFGTPILS